MSDDIVQPDQIVSEKRAKGAGLERILSVARRRKRLALVASPAPPSVGLTITAAMPSIYRATATVIVDRQQVRETFVTSTVTSALETRLHTISQETLSRSRLEALIGQFDLYPELRQRYFPRRSSTGCAAISPSSSKASTCAAPARPPWRSRSGTRASSRRRWP